MEENGIPRQGRRKPGYVVFFFQAEDGIRDYKVTGVQTCALPIFERLYFKGGQLKELIAILDRQTQTGATGQVKVVAYLKLDRKSTRLNSSHLVISYAVFCLKKKKNTYRHTSRRDPRATRIWCDRV